MMHLKLEFNHEVSKSTENHKGNVKKRETEKEV